MLFIGVYEQDGKQTAKLYNSFEDWHRDTWNPETNIIDLLELSLSLKGVEVWTIHPGRKTSNYKKRKMLLEDKAHQWQQIAAENSLSWGELCTVSNWFENQGKRYGLLAEFQANCIC